MIIRSFKPKSWLGRDSSVFRSINSAPLPVQLALVFTLSVLFFLSLRTSDYLAVDGALRALQVYQLGRPFLHPNNHLLYAINVYAWSAFVGWLGIHPKDPFAFLRIAQAMNAIAAAGFLTMLYGFCYNLTNRAAIACLVTIGCGLSRAFFAHAINSAEPMVGLFYSGLSTNLAIYGITRRRIWACIAAGGMLALAMETYQSMALIGPAVVFLIWRWPGRQARIFSTLGLISGFTAGVFVIVGAAFYWAGARSGSDILHRFLQTEPALQQNGGLQIARTTSVLAGLAYALFPCLPRECSGFRCLSFVDNHFWIPIAALAVILAGAGLIAILVLSKTLWAHMAERERIALAGCGVGFGFTMIPLAWWLPTYDKFWLQPLACLFLASGIIAHVTRRAANTGMLMKSFLAWSCAVAFVLIGLSNTATVLWNNATSPQYLADARQVAALVKSEDLLVGDWNPVFLVYQAFWAGQANSFNVPTRTIHVGARTISELRQAVIRTEQRGGKVFFLGLLDIPASQWRLTFEGPALPYSEFDEYRRATEKIESFRYRERVVALWRHINSTISGARTQDRIQTEKLRLRAGL
jgi:hypothetical protein